MIKSHEMPAWFMQDIDDDALIGATTIVFEREDQFFFDGVVANLLKQGKIPHSMEIVLDAGEMSCLGRLNYGDGSDDAAFYTSFEIESFALLWNADPKSIHGIEGDNITLVLIPGDARYPFVCSAGINCELYYEGDRFLAQPDLEFADELLMEEAA